MLLKGKKKNKENVGQFQFWSTVLEVKIWGIKFSLDIKRMDKFNHKDILSKITTVGMVEAKRPYNHGKIHLLKT